MFSAELLIMILENLHKSDPESLIQLRVVSKQFNSLIIPITYHEINLTPLLMQCLSNNFKPKVDPTANWQVTHDICSYTRHIVIRELVDWEVANNLLRSMDRLESFTWLYESTAFLSTAFAPVAETLRKDWPAAGHRLDRIKDREFQSFAMLQFYHVRGGDPGVMAWLTHACNSVPED